MKTQVKALLLLAMVTSATFANSDSNQVKSFDFVSYTTIEGKLQVNILNHSRHPVYISLQTFNGRTIHSKVITGRQHKPAIVYNVSDLEPGQYQIYISNKECSWVRLFKIEQPKTQLQRDITFP